jgi:hypothetical protein
VMAVAVSAVNHPADEALALLPDPLHCGGVVLRGERCLDGLEVVHPEIMNLIGPALPGLSTHLFRFCSVRR